MAVSSTGNGSGSGLAAAAAAAAAAAEDDVVVSPGIAIMRAMVVWCQGERYLAIAVREIGGISFTARSKVLGRRFAVCMMFRGSMRPGINGPFDGGEIPLCRRVGDMKSPTIPASLCGQSGVGAKTGGNAPELF